MNWLTNQLDNHCLFRRLVVLAVLALVYVATVKSFDSAMVLASTKLDGQEIVLILGAVHVPVLTLMGYVFKEYNKGRMQKHDGMVEPK